MKGGKLPQNLVQQHFLKQAQQGGGQQGGGGDNPKGKLSAALCALLERNVTKDDCVYEMDADSQPGKFIATLQIAALTTEKTEFKGKPAENKKTAEANAAQKCLNVLQKEIKVALKAKEERDEEKRKEKAAANKERQEAKKAEKAAEAAEAAA